MSEQRTDGGHDRKDDELYMFSLPEAASLLRVDKAFLLREIEKGRLKARLVGSRWRIARWALRAWQADTEAA